MSEETNVYELLQKAREYVIEKSPKKDGENTYGKYNYFTPEFVEHITHEASKKVGCICLCDLKADEFGLYQTLAFVHIESGLAIGFELRTKHGTITATNEAQQMGGTDTYSERYIKMKVFGIKDNAIDPDSQDHSKPKAKSKDEITNWFNPKNEAHLDAIASYRKEGMSNDEIVKKIRSTPKMGISKANAELITTNKI